MTTATQEPDLSPIRPLAKMPKTFAGLCRLHPLRPVQTEKQWAEASRVMFALVGDEHALTPDQADYLLTITNPGRGL